MVGGSRVMFQKSAFLKMCPQKTKKHVNKNADLKFLEIDTDTEFPPSIGTGGVWWKHPGSNTSELAKYWIAINSMANPPQLLSMKYWLVGPELSWFMKQSLHNWVVGHPQHIIPKQPRSPVFIVQLCLEAIFQLKHHHINNIILHTSCTWSINLQESKKTPTYPWSIPQESINPQMKGIPS